jgi:hypothetical protein
MTAIAPDNLAETLKAILDHLVRIEEGQQKLRVEMAEVSGKVSQMPTLVQTVTITFMIMAGTFGGIASLLAMAHYLLGVPK